MGGNELNLLPVSEQLADAHTLVLSGRGVLAFSGHLLAESRQHHAPAADLRPVQFFLSHSRHDGKLPAFYTDEAATFLQTLGYTRSITTA